MPGYRRSRVAGGTFFFTVNLLDRRSDLLVRHVDALREAVRQTRLRAPFHIDAWAVLPDHMHCLWTLPERDADFPSRWRAIKIAFSSMVLSSTRQIGRTRRFADASRAACIPPDGSPAAPSRKRPASGGETRAARM